jgi:hypothetical protein
MLCDRRVLCISTGWPALIDRGYVRRYNLITQGREAVWNREGKITSWALVQFL